jgi:hypothetical protein
MNKYTIMYIYIYTHDTSPCYLLSTMRNLKRLGDFANQSTSLLNPRMTKILYKKIKHVIEIN